MTLESHREGRQGQWYFQDLPNVANTVVTADKGAESSWKKQLYISLSRLSTYPDPNTGSAQQMTVTQQPVNTFTITVTAKGNVTSEKDLSHTDRKSCGRKHSRTHVNLTHQIPSWPEM